jgi:hypothetical protein
MLEYVQVEKTSAFTLLQSSGHMHVLVILTCTSVCRFHIHLKLPTTKYNTCKPD